MTSWEKATPGTARNDIPIKLGPVGGRIVAEVFAALLRGDALSYLHTYNLGGAPFTPSLTSRPNQNCAPGVSARIVSRKPMMTSTTCQP